MAGILASKENTEDGTNSVTFDCSFPLGNNILVDKVKLMEDSPTTSRKDLQVTSTFTLGDPSSINNCERHPRLKLVGEESESVCVDGVRRAREESPIPSIRLAAARAAARGSRNNSPYGTPGGSPERNRAGTMNSTQIRDRRFSPATRRPSTPHDVIVNDENEAPPCYSTDDEENENKEQEMLFHNVDGKDSERLEKVCIIGTGTFGRVHLVRRESEKFAALKILGIHDVIQMKQVEHVHSEKTILLTLNHPFIVKLYWTYKDEKALYMLFEYLPGGEIFSYLRSAGKFSSRVGMFYTAEIVCALEYLHFNGIVYRDMKPENLILDKDGHLRLTDFGFAKQLNDRTWTLCGTPEYLAPEIIESRGHNRAVDWWSLGILVYEMLAGYPPFRGENALEIYEKVVEGSLKFPKGFDLVAKDLVRKFLVSDRTKRLGNMKGGAEDVKKHKWFKELDWSDVFAKKVPRLQPPIIPKVYHEGDSGNFDEYDEEELSRLSTACDAELQLFQNW